MSTYGPQAYNVDINQLGTSQLPRFSINKKAPYRDGLVEDIILNEEHPEYSSKYGYNIGMVKVRIIPDDRGVANSQLNWAMPLDSTIREYPLKNEIVMIFYSVGRLFYTRRVNINNKITENTWPGLSQQFSPNTVSSVKSEEVVTAARGGPAYRPENIPESTKLGDTFIENPSVKMARPYEGDTIIQSRHGTIARFGSNRFSNPVISNSQPNLLLTVGLDGNKFTSTERVSPYSLIFEDINKDKSCIWMVVDEKIVLEPATLGSEAHLRGTEFSDSTKYTGAQIFINSDRIILNSKLNEISLFSKKEINLSALQSITMSTDKSINISAEKDIEITTPEDIVLTARSIIINSPNDIAQGTSGNYIISGAKIYIGSDGDESQPMVLGGELARVLYELVDTLARATIITSTGPAFFDPIALGRLQVLLAQDLGTRTSPQSATFNSRSNFTSKTNS